MDEIASLPSVARNDGGDGISMAGGDYVVTMTGEKDLVAMTEQINTPNDGREGHSPI